VRTNIELIRPVHSSAVALHLQQHAFAAANDLLVALPPDTRERLWPHLEHVYLDRRHDVAQAAIRIEYVYFPVGCLLSVLIHTTSGASAEVGLIGNEGASGIITLLGESRPPLRVVIDTPGPAYRARLDVLRRLMAADSALRAVMLRYAAGTMVELARAVVCNTHHSVSQRLCRTLLARVNRAGTERITMTHENMASMLGTRRAGVTRAALELRHAGIISYSRGRVVVLDRPRLEAAACECSSG